MSFSLRSVIYSKFGRALIVFLIYGLLAVIYTSPLIFKMAAAAYGYAGDNLGAIRYLWWWKYTFLNRLDLHNSFLEQTPFGFKIDNETGSVLYYWPLKLLTLLFNEHSAYNLVLLLSFPTAALSMYLLTKSLISGSLISFWAGFVFSFSPYHFWKAYNHLDLALLWPFPLATLFWLKVLKSLAGSSKFEIKNIMLASLFSVSTILTNFYYGFFLLISIILLTSFSTLIQKISFRKISKSCLLFSSTTLLFSLPFLAPTIYDAYVQKGAGQSAARQANYQRPLLDVVSLSARPWDYLIPSQDNPIFGRFVPGIYNWIKTLGKDFKVISGPVHERTIFLGFTSLFLLMVNGYLLIVSSDFRRRYGRLSLILWLMIVSLFLISMPPYIFLKGRYTVYLPSYLLYLVLPVFRTYSRLGIFVLLFVILNAALVIDFFFKRIKVPKFISYFLILISFSALEFANLPPSKVVNLKMPQALTVLAQKDDGAPFVVYPKEFNVAELLAFQSQFKRGFLNFHSQSEYYDLWHYLDNFYDPKVPHLLSALGIKYAVFQKKLVFPQVNPVDDLWYTRALRDPLLTLPSGFVLEKDFEGSSVYRIEADPIPLIVFGRRRIDAFPRRPFVLKKDNSRIYLASLSGVENLEFRLSLQRDDETTTWERFSGENIKLIRSGGDTSIVLKEKFGFLDLNDLKDDLLIDSLLVRVKDQSL